MISRQQLGRAITMTSRCIKQQIEIFEKKGDYFILDTRLNQFAILRTILLTGDKTVKKLERKKQP